MSAPAPAATVPGMTDAQAGWFADTGDLLARGLNEQLPGAPHAVRLGVLALLAGGPLWLEDAPGTGKTTLARALGGCIQGLAPVTVPGPDPRAELLLLDLCPGEGRAVDAAVLGREEADARPAPLLTVLSSHEDPDTDERGPSPAVRDRILLRTSMGRPDHAATVRLLSRHPATTAAPVRPPLLTREALHDMRGLASTVELNTPLLGYLAHLMEETHRRAELRGGVSPRAGLDLVRAVRTRAALAGRPRAVPADIQALLHPVWAHRLRLDAEAEYAGSTVGDVLRSVLGAVSAPRARGRGA